MNQSSTWNYLHYVYVLTLVYVDFVPVLVFLTQVGDQRLLSLKTVTVVLIFHLVHSSQPMRAYDTKQANQNTGNKIIVRLFCVIAL
jgi:hypothetical protein